MPLLRSIRAARRRLPPFRKQAPFRVERRQFAVRILRAEITIRNTAR